MPPPTLDSVAPATICTGGVLTLTGSGFLPGATVTIGNTDITGADVQVDPGGTTINVTVGPIPPGGPLNNLSRKAAMSLFHKGLEQVVPLAEELNVNILIEPEPDLLMENTKEFKPFIREVQSPMVGLNFDIGHFFCAGEDPAGAFEELFEYVGHVHIEDIAATRVHNHLIAGHGVIRFLDIFKTMAKLKYQGDISLELYPYTDTPESAGQESLEYLRPIFKKSGLNIT